jgi:signal transduction histidine kinase
MKSAKIPLDEEKRLQILKSFNVLDSLAEEEYDSITKIAAQICNTPIALVSLVDSNRQWFKSKYGLSANETSRDYAFCAHSILEPDRLFIVPDATKDPRFKDNPLTTNSPNVIFYAGAPLKTKEGYALGTLCVIDNKPRESLSEGQKISLIALAQQVVSQLELRKRNTILIETNKEIKRLNKELSQFAHKLSHDLKTPISGINALVEFIKEDLEDLPNNSSVFEWTKLITSRTNYIESLIESLLYYNKVTNADLIFEKFNLKVLLENIIKNDNKLCNIKLDLKGLDSQILHSKISLYQILQNLLSNSIRFNDKDNCEVSVELINEKDFYHFIYKDNGPGIPHEYKDKVFLMFETLEDENCKNIGIGLTIVKSIIDRLGGWIILNERDGLKEGVCFQFTILKSPYSQEMLFNF